MYKTGSFIHVYCTYILIIHHLNKVRQSSVTLRKRLKNLSYEMPFDLTPNVMHPFAVLQVVM